MKGRILVTTRDFGAHTGLRDELECMGDITYSRTPPEGEDYDGIIAGTADLTPLQLEAIPSLKVVARVGVGYDNVPLDWCRAHDVRATYTPNAPSEAVADLTIGLMLHGLRRFSSDRVRTWSRYHGKQLSKCTVGIIGRGRIGGLVYDRVEWAEDVMAYDTIPGRRTASLEDVLAFSDIVTLHIPGSTENANFMDAEKFSQMKTDAVFINTSRGSVVDEDALAFWLGWNRDAFACVDVFKSEPYNGPLRQFANCLLTPHMASCTHTSRRDMEQGAINAVRWYVGVPRPSVNAGGYEVLV